MFCFDSVLRFYFDTLEKEKERAGSKRLWFLFSYFFLPIICATCQRYVFTIVYHIFFHVFHSLCWVNANAIHSLNVCACMHGSFFLATPVVQSILSLLFQSIALRSMCIPVFIEKYSRFLLFIYFPLYKRYGLCDEIPYFKICILLFCLCCCLYSMLASLLTRSLAGLLICQQ